jgi:hypothetical protein
VPPSRKVIGPSSLLIVRRATLDCVCDLGIATAGVSRVHIWKIGTITGISSSCRDQNRKTGPTLTPQFVELM